MKPYYDANGITIYHGDCREIFPKLQVPALVVTDPPYEQTRQAWDKWPAGWVDLLRSTPQFWCFGSLRMFWDRKADFDGLRLAQEIIWEKQNGSSPLNDRFRRVHEMAVHFYPSTRRWGDLYHVTPYVSTGTRKRIIRGKQPPHWGRIGAGSYEVGAERIVRSVMQAPNAHRQGGHANAKPVSIVRCLVEYSCPPGGVVADLFMGGGATLLAAREAGRPAIGIEVNERECERAALRLSQDHLTLS